MHKNRLWLIFLSIVAAVTLWYAAVAFYKVHQYCSLTQVTSARTEQWSVKEIGRDEFAPYVHYSFMVNSVRYFGESLVFAPYFRNAWAVEEEIPKLAEKEWLVWYNPSNPYYSTLQKKFPVKECIFAGVLFTLLLYFVGLGYYVSKSSLC